MLACTNDAGSSSWTIGTTVAGATVTVGSDKSISAAFGVTGNTVTDCSYCRACCYYSYNYCYALEYIASAASYSTVAISRSLTSGATLAATYSTLDDSLTLKASVAF